MDLMNSVTMKKIYLLLFALLFAWTAEAQNDHKGCHHYRSKAPVKKFSEYEKNLMEVSNARSDTFDILHYDIHLDVTDYSGMYLEGFTEITFQAIEAGQDNIRFDFYQLEVDSVVNDSGQLMYAYDGDILNVELDETAELNQEQSLTVYYKGNPYRDPYWGGFYFEADYIYNLGIGLTTIPPNFGKVWYPCFDSFAERAMYTYHITSAGGRKAHCQGELLSETVISGDTVERVWDFDFNVTTHQSAIAVADYYTHEWEHEGEFGTIPVTLKAQQAQFESMDDIFVELGTCIDALEYWYGPYPFDRVGYVMTTDGALEIPENIAYPASMTGADLFSNGQLFAHELGHMWWGNIVTPWLHNHMWIKEGPAEYSGHLFVEYQDGEEAFQEVVKDNMYFVLNEAHIQDDGFQVLSPIPDEQIYGRHTYYKGAAVMHNLRAYMGDETFREALQEVQINQAYSSLDADMFRDAFEEASGVELDDFFNDWIFAPGYSTFVIDSTVTTEVDGAYETQVFLQQKLREAPAFHSNVPVELSALNSDWEYEAFEFVADGQYSDFTITTSYEPVLVVFNENNKLNGARMDYQTVIEQDQYFNENLPWAELRLKKNELDGDAFVRICHIWASPDQNYSHPAIDEMSTTHYWEVTGDWPAGAEFEARIDYVGAEPLDLDYALVGVTEEDIMLLYRESAEDEWLVYPDYQVFAGSLTSGTGNIKIEPFIPGQYCFANGDVSLTTPELELSENEFKVFPNPANNQVQFLGWDMSFDIDQWIRVYDSMGRLVKEESVPAGTGNVSMDVSDLIDGHYIVTLNNKDEAIDSTTLEIVR